ncbi:hypothetical protein L227DRAFT_650053 [Lentinus tigrinus ALCF2SS1-6]|uniref:Uncharacterized protein n=1 Tax=Lentinus tigrinus ALCF2SS1-6 TaxID=1328759 RepID=A0A5C2SUG3_9APHY|nr:hypothetical protein L227DRAFT_650053 [Lentinus tigrinus ALCF2SS1-6]
MADSATTAASLLAEIPSESLQSFLATVRRESVAAGSTFIPVLDAHLSSVNSRRASHNWPLNQGDVLEIQGPATSGKTHLLYHLLVTCLMPRSYNGKELGGWGKAAVFFDTDDKLNISRLYTLLLSRMRRLIGSEDITDASVPLEDVASQRLENLHIFRPTSSVQLAINLLHLPKYHATEPRLRDKEIGLLVIDSLSAFYWRDRYTLEQLREAADGTAQGLPPNPLHHVLRALQRFRTSHRPVILLANWGLNALAKPSPAGEPASPFYRQHLYPFPAPFEPHGAHEAMLNIENSQRRSASVDARSDTSSTAQRSMETTLPLHHHITLQSSPIDPFPASYSLADAASQEHMRAVLVNKGDVRGLVRTPGDNNVVEFTFRIGEDEILVQPDKET